MLCPQSCFNKKCVNNIWMQKKVKYLFHAIVMQYTQFCHLRFKPMRKKETIDFSIICACQHIID
jgi:hypothetical protein